MGMIGLFGEGIQKQSDDDEATKELDEGWAVTGRVIATPVLQDHRLLHFGAAVSYRRANDHGGTQMGTPLRVRQRPEASITSIRMLDTGPLADTDAVVTWNVESAWILGPFSLQGEFLSMTVDRKAPGAVDPTFRGFYVMGSWLLSGESRRYNAANGTFGNPRVRRIAGQGGHGAWELLARISRLDLNDRTDRPDGVLGGEQTNLAAGLTWYPNDNLRFMLNYVKVVDMKRPGHMYDGTRPGIVLLRTQVIW
jgi:phosphate-selective porin OprO and OprP